MSSLLSAPCWCAAIAVLFLLSTVPAPAKSSSSSSSSSTGAGYAQQICDEKADGSYVEYFYCPYLTNPGCAFTRSQRCPVNKDASVCTQSGKNEEGCEYYKALGGFPVVRFRANLSRRKKRNLFPRLQHEGILYRGFVYEWGGSYKRGQQLDTLDPQFKYLGGADGYRVLDTLGHSTCTESQAFSFMKEWTSTHTYSPAVIKDNCQDFADALAEYLVHYCGGTRSGKRRKRSVSACVNSTLSGASDTSAGESHFISPNRFYPPLMAALALLMPMLIPFTNP